MQDFRKKSVFALLFAMVFISIGFYPSHGKANTLSDILSQKTLEFTVIQESLFQKFVKYTLIKYCPSEFPIALDAIALDLDLVTLPDAPNGLLTNTVTDAPTDAVMDALVVQLLARDPIFFRIFEDCQDFDHVLKLYDQFTLKVPEYFARETLPLASIILRGPTRDDSLEERLLEMNAFIQNDIKKDYTVKKLLARLELLVPKHSIWDRQPGVQYMLKK